jgi:hypothetical protein
MKDDFLKMLGLVLFIGIFIYLVVRSLKLQSSIMEGLTNPDTSSVSDDALAQNKASGSQAFADEINKLYLKITDNLMIKDNRVGYENVIVQMDDYVTALMVQKIMSINKSTMTEDSIVSTMEKINTLNQGKASLNSMMKFIDGIN